MQGLYSAMWQKQQQQQQQDLEPGVFSNTETKEQDGE